MLALALLLACPAKRSYPDAEQRLDADLSAPVEVLIDSRGVPHVYAETLSDAYLAVGFMHARDRGFQLELVRKAASGRLTELFGEGLLDVDRRLRVLSYQIEALEANLPPVERERAQAYADGVNRGLAELPEPMEFRLLKHEPEPWTVRDVLLVARLQAWDLSHDMVHELVRDRLRALVDAETLRFLTQPSVALGASILEPDPSAWPVPPGQAPPPQAPPLAGQPALAQADVAHPIEITENLSPPGELIVDAVVRWREDLDEGCSNAWAVHGSRTASAAAPRRDPTWT
ncbi:MAG: penicillin acylase family protein [Alphaproteobacteria bacterium]|nr:penicillin acylase family protein [Alphaproteobacteria bacterium]